MSPRCYPVEPHFADRSERVVWQELERQLPDNAVLISNLALRDDNKEIEFDLVVAWPNVGVAVLEVKGGKIHYPKFGESMSRHQVRKT